MCSSVEVAAVKASASSGDCSARQVGASPERLHAGARRQDAVRAQSKAKGSQAHAVEHKLNVLFSLQGRSLLNTTYLQWHRTSGYRLHHDGKSIHHFPWVLDLLGVETVTLSDLTLNLTYWTEHMPQAGCRRSVNGQRSGHRLIWVSSQGSRPHESQQGTAWRCRQALHYQNSKN